VVLEGDQCLVFFLGGIGGTHGFSTNGANPAQNPNANPNPNPALAWGDRVAPFYEFNPSRLMDPKLVVPTRPSSPAFPVYIDPYRKMPFEYFSSYKQRNGYGRYSATFGNSDCSLVPNGAYNDGATPPNYYDPEGFQIISAGRDKLFGPGGAWTQVTASTMPQAGRDDLTNFYDKLMGTP
jgi:hypothetical protein